MATNSGSWDGVAAICWPERTSLPFLALAVTGVAVGIGISISKIPERFYSKKDDDGDINEGLINQLPDDLLCDILARLCLFEAVRSRRVSRRWRDIFPYRPTLIFNCLDMCGERDFHSFASPKKLRQFVKAVDQTLRLYSGGKISYAKMSCCFAHNYVSEFRGWMQTFVNLGVEELDVRYLCHPISEGCYCLAYLYVFPFHLLFQSASLKVLHLSACVLEPSFQGQFKSLETLNLFLVELHEVDLPGILSSCVNLQYWRMTRCLLPRELCISGSCLRLKFLMIETCPGLRVIDLNAANLTNFGCYTTRSIKYIFSCVPKLEQIYVLCNSSGTVPYMLGEVAKGCPNLKSMLFQSKSNELPYLRAKMNMFGKLTHLELLMRFDSYADLLNIAPVLSACPILEKLRLMARSPVDEVQKGARWPVLCHVHLKEVEFLGFCGTGNQIEFFLFLVRSAPALNLLMIRSIYGYYVGHGRCCNEAGTPIEKNNCKFIFDEFVKQAVSRRLDVVFE